MTEAEKQEIVGLVMTQISSQAVDFDIATEQPQANDLLTAVRKTLSGEYVGVTIKWDDVARIATEVANRAAERAEQAETDANNILEQVQSKGTEITNFVATSKTEIETQKNESVNAVKSVYQTDLNELKGDLDNKLPKSPVNWETWTDEERMAARERMGIPGGYELIEEITLEEDVSSISRWSEPNGTPYRFSAFCIIAEINVSDSDTSYYLRVDASSKETPNIFLEYFDKNSIKNKRININYEALSPNLFRLSSEINDKSNVLFTKGNVSVRNSSYDRPLLSTIVNKIYIGNITFLAGTKIKIYGVRA